MKCQSFRDASPKIYTIQSVELSGTGPTTAVFRCAYTITFRKPYTFADVPATPNPPGSGGT